MTQNWAFLFGYTNIIVNGVIILITILNLLVYKFQKLQEAEFVEQNKLLLSLSIRGLCYRFSLDQMKQATSNFHDDLVIGKGGFGKVYKGTFEVGPTVVAIKRRRFQSSQGSTEFRMEIKMLSKFRHSHLVSLIGYCDDGYEMILVYEFMQGGTLADHLHKRVMQGDKFLPPLSWVERLKICIGAARGLDYLHTGTGIQHGIIHRDVKTTNILLDENFAAKISDFGLSKISPANQAITYVSTHVKGTFGYFDPYYFATRRLTRKSDVYSFGVVLFEVLSGRPAVDRSLDEDQIGLAGWAQHCFREGLLSQIIDPRIEGEVFTDSLEAFVKVALQCLHPGPKHRPTMAEVVVGLQSALALQEKSTDYYLPEIITSDSNEEDTDFSSLELENDNSEKGMVDISTGRHQDKQSSTGMAFKKKIGVFLSLAARAISVNPYAKTKLKKCKLRDLERATSNFEEVNDKVNRSARYYSPDWRTWATVAIQLAWRRYRHQLTLSSLSFIRPRRPLSRCSSLGEDSLRLYAAFLKDKATRSVRYYSRGWRTWATVAIQLAWRRYRHRLTLSSLSFIRPRRPLSRCSSLGEDRLRLYAALLTSPKPNQDDFDF